MGKRYIARKIDEDRWEIEEKEPEWWPESVVFEGKEAGRSDTRYLEIGIGMGFIGLLLIPISWFIFKYFTPESWLNIYRLLAAVGIGAVLLGAIFLALVLFSLFARYVALPIAGIALFSSVVSAVSWFICWATNGKIDILARLFHLIGADISSKEWCAYSVGILMWMSLLYALFGGWDDE